MMKLSQILFLGKIQDHTQAEKRFRYQTDTLLEDRQRDYQERKKAHPDRIFIVCETHKSVGRVLTIKLLVMQDIPMNRLIVTLKNELIKFNLLQLSLQIFAKGIICNNDDTVQSVWERAKNADDQILYLTVLDQDWTG